MSPRDTRAVRAVLVVLVAVVAVVAAPSAARAKWGLADLHAHPASHLAFGHSEGLCTEGIFHGAPGTSYDGSAAPEDLALQLADDLERCAPGSHSECPPVSAVQEAMRAELLATLEQSLRHAPPGPPDYSSWPSANSLSHQQMHVAWIHRAWQDGALRLLVASVTDNELLEQLYRHDGLCTPELEAFGSSPRPEFAFYSAIEQLEFIRFLDDKNDWMEVVTSPEDARRVIEEGRLAVVLGVEMDSLTRDQIVELVENWGVRSVIPVHLTDNDFGGTAVYEDLFNTLNEWQNGQYLTVVEDPAVGLRLDRPQDVVVARELAGSIPLFCPGPFGCCSIKPVDLDDQAYEDLGYGDPWAAEAGHRNARGFAEEEVRALLELGVLVDVAHMSWKTTDETIALAEQYGYPLIDSHTGLREGCSADEGESERQLTWDHAARIAGLGGVVGLGTGGEPPRQRLVSSFGWPAQRFTGHLEAWRVYRQPFDRPPANPEARISSLSVRLKSGYDGLAACGDLDATLELHTTRGTLRRAVNRVGGAAVELPGGSLHVHGWNLEASPLGAVRLREIQGFVLKLEQGGACSDAWDLQHVAIEYVGAGGVSRGLLVERAGGPWRRLGDGVDDAAFDLTPHFRAEPDKRFMPVDGLDVTAEIGDDAFDSDVVLALSLRGRGTRRVVVDDVVGEPALSQTPGARASGTWTFDPAWGSITYGEIEGIWLESGDQRDDLNSDHGDVAALVVDWRDGAVTGRLADFDDGSLRGAPSFRLDRAIDTTQVFRGLDDEIAATATVDTIGFEVTTSTEGTLKGPADLAFLRVDGTEVVLPAINGEEDWVGTKTSRASFLDAPVRVRDLWAIEVRKKNTEPLCCVNNWNLDGIRIDKLSDPLGPWLDEFWELFGVMALSGDEPRIALGTDFNGLSPQMPFVEFDEKDLPTTLDMVPDGAGGPRHDTSTGETLRLGRHGLAHVGMLADFGDMVARRDATAGSTLYWSAMATVDAWERAVEAAARVRDGEVIGEPVDTGLCRPSEK